MIRNFFFIFQLDQDKSEGMWIKWTILGIAFTAFSSFETAAGDKSIKSGPVLASTALGDQCQVDGDILKCPVKRGETATFVSTLNIDGSDSHLGLDSLQLTLRWPKFGDVVTRAQTCIKYKGQLEINGSCTVTAIPEGSYYVVPFPVTIPSPTKRVSK
ncbi:hypothetical protein J6590_002254 [Homalodisca vitripennis]|nr:hypothetical protein J6590_002254 [Homalodisca vitripennis]